MQDVKLITGTFDRKFNEYGELRDWLNSEANEHCQMYEDARDVYKGINEILKKSNSIAIQDDYHHWKDYDK